MKNFLEFLPALSSDNTVDNFFSKILEDKDKKRFPDQGEKNIHCSIR